MAPRQLNIFNHSGIHTVVRDVKESLRDEVKNTGLSRDQVLDKVNQLAKRHGVAMNGRGELSKDLFEKYLNPEDDSRNPSIKGLTVLCAALETVQPLESIATILGGRVISEEDVRMLEWAKAYHASKALRRKMRKIEEEF